MISHLDYTRRRLLQTSQRLRALIYARTRPVDELLVSQCVDRISWDDVQALEYRSVELGERFGPLWATYWFRVRATVPEEWRGERVDLLWRSNSEAALWIDGRVLGGLNQHHADAVLADDASPGGLEFHVELACNGLFGKQASAVELKQCELGVYDTDAARLAYDFEVLRALEAHEASDPALAGDLRGRLSDFADTWERDVEAACAILDELLERRNGSVTHEIAAVGHAHIDTAWLWPLAETYRKTLRTFSTQLRLMDEYPEYRFACSRG